MKQSLNKAIKNIYFRLSPFLILAAIELLLLVFSMGQSYRLFKRSDDSYALNVHYPARYYSREQFETVSLDSFSVPIEKEEGTRRIFLIGDQSVYSMMSRQQLKDLTEPFKDDSGRINQIYSIIIPYANSFAVNGLARDLKSYSPDAVIALTGMAEFYGLPRRSKWLKDISNYGGVKLYTYLKKYRLVQLLESFLYIEKDAPRDFPPKDIENFVVPYASDLYVITESHFQKNLRNLRHGEEYPLFLVTLPINYKAEPYRSIFEDDEMNDRAIALECSTLLNNSDIFSIQRWLKDLKEWEPGTASYYYCNAKIREKEGDREDALKNYIKSRNMDGFRYLMQSDFNTDIRNACRLWGYELIDAETKLIEDSKNHMSIDNYFYDSSSLNTMGITTLKMMIRDSIKDYFIQ